MKIGVVTLPLSSNYGGILQAYALKAVLENLGHEVIMIKHKAAAPKLLPIKVRYLSYIKRSLIKIFFKRDIIIRYDKFMYKFYTSKLNGTTPFINKYIQSQNINIGNCNFNEFDAIIVGSDQIWRPLYAQPIENYFLNFLDNNSKIIKIAYAASFGTDIWEYTPEQTKECARLAKQFNLITVREDTGVKLCHDYFGVKAEHVLDPTMLIKKDQYIKIVEKEEIQKSSGNLLAYILDDSPDKMKIICNIAKINKLSLNYIMPTDKQVISGVPYPGVAVWLRAFIDAELVITDSFHGCVFSIIFNKPFIVFGNNERGQSRFNSLLRLFNLQKRLVNINDFSYEVLSDYIDWDSVNSILKNMQEKSTSLLIKSLETKIN